jgi:hypothetical protein
VVVCEDIKEIIEENYSNTYTPNYWWHELI